MNKPEFIQRMADDCGISKAAARKTIDYFTKTVTNILENGESLNISGFGQWRIITTSPKRYRHPVTGEMMEMSETRRVKFTPSTNIANNVAGLST